MAGTVCSTNTANPVVICIVSHTNNMNKGASPAHVFKEMTLKIFNQYLNSDFD